MSDVAGGRSMENTLNYLLAECTYGQVQGNEKFVDTLYPYQSMHGASDALNDVKAFNKAQKKKRTALQSAFTSGPGRPISASYDHVLSCLFFPQGPLRDAAKVIQMYHDHRRNFRPRLH
ncbi:hypothetical protein DYB37_011810 [Aphanomyces astaci]|nr:hypothetical protein DYB34_013696 [Aphanomyces astaci]RHZ30429.1 hypothetical protein DYB37_011810 [Aphanomyces astaci]RLO07239.1 hypothetical protein DYB28_001344 [Aphanomyces astaci]